MKFLTNSWPLDCTLGRTTCSIPKQIIPKERVKNVLKFRITIFWIRPLKKSYWHPKLTYTLENSKIWVSIRKLKYLKNGDLIQKNEIRNFRQEIAFKDLIVFKKFRWLVWEKHSLRFSEYFLKMRFYLSVTFPFQSSSMFFLHNSDLSQTGYFRI